MMKMTQYCSRCKGAQEFEVHGQEAKCLGCGMLYEAEIQEVNKSTAVPEKPVEAKLASAEKPVEAKPVPTAPAQPEPEKPVATEPVAPEQGEDGGAEVTVEKKAAAQPEPSAQPTPEAEKSAEVVSESEDDDDEFGRAMEELNAEVGRARDAEARAEKEICELKERLADAQTALDEAEAAHGNEIAQLEKEHGEQVSQLLQDLVTAKAQRDERQSRLCAILADGTYAASVKLQEARAELEAMNAELEKRVREAVEVKVGEAERALSAAKSDFLREKSRKGAMEREVEVLANKLARAEEELAKLKSPPQPQPASKPPTAAPPKKKGWFN